MNRLWLATTIGLLATACTDEEGEPPHDAATCKVAASYALATAATATVGSTPGGHATLTITLDAGPPRDTLFFKLIPGAGAFASGVRAGTFPIGGADTGFQSCGLCVNIVADIVAGQGPTKFYQATGGEVTLTSVAPPYAGSVKNLTFAEVDLGGAVVPGCATKVSAASFSTGT